jgi:hypothetical protein
MIEAYLAVHAGVSPDVVDRCHRAYDAERNPGDYSEPGPFTTNILVAEEVERLLARKLGVDWSAYKKEVMIVG